MTYKQAVWKRNTELVLMFPFVLVGRIAGYLFPLKTRHSIFLFFPSADLGGSIKVNADITACIRDKKPLIIFSKKPRDNGFRELFEMEGVRTIDLHRYIDNKLFHFVNFFFRGVLATWINREENSVVFGGEGLFFYKVIPHLKKSVRCIELCHLNTWFNFTQGFIPYMDVRIFSTPKIKRDAEKQFETSGIPKIYLDRLRFIDNKVDIPMRNKASNQLLEILFVGRGAPQKRVHLIGDIAKKLHEKKSPVHFSFVGEVEHLLPARASHYCKFYGNVSDQSVLQSIYKNSDVLILTSAYEGLPIVVMDMMVRGKVVLSTAIDGIPDYIKHEDNGLLIYETEESEIIAEAVRQIERLTFDRKLLADLGERAYQFARAHFNGEVFCKTYRELLVVT